MPRKSSAALHPFRRWLESERVSHEDVSRFATAFGSPISAGYVRHVLNGYRRPSYGLAEVLSRMTGGAVTVAEFMKYERDAA